MWRKSPLATNWFLETDWTDRDVFELSVKSHFSAAHRLVDYQGKCASLHGHNWTVEVFVRGEPLSEAGMLVDFRQLKEALKETLEILDHSELNAQDSFGGIDPTSENIARWLYGELSSRLNTDAAKVYRVCVGETPETTASYWEA